MHPPIKSKYCTGPSEYELQAQRKAAINEKARLRMARKRAALKALPPEDQATAKARARAHQATYRAKNRQYLKEWEAHRRNEAYKAKYGAKALSSYLRAKRHRRINRVRRKEAYHPADDPHSDDTDDHRGAKAARRDLQHSTPRHREPVEDGGDTDRERDSEDDGESGYDQDDDTSDGESSDDNGDDRYGWSRGRPFHFDSFGRRVDPFGRRVDASGRRLDADGNFIW
ncbi:hypothetical protein DFH06DRAFT_1342504 [Mycena polygramma]|nr:hypothetical protein DFH06DRAFT_1342504 [Mycena polygramma]